MLEAFAFLLYMGFIGLLIVSFSFIVLDGPKLLTKALDLHHQRKLKELELKKEDLRWLEQYKE